MKTLILLVAFFITGWALAEAWLDTVPRGWSATEIGSDAGVTQSDEEGSTTARPLLVGRRQQRAEEE